MCYCLIDIDFNDFFICDKGNYNLRRHTLVLRCKHKPKHDSFRYFFAIESSQFGVCYLSLFRRARQRCFWLLAFISRPQVRNIHLPGRMILSGSLIPSDKYFLKNLTFVVRNPLVWLRHHSSQTLYVARVKSNN